MINARRTFPRGCDFSCKGCFFTDIKTGVCQSLHGMFIISKGEGPFDNCLGGTFGNKRAARPVRAQNRQRINEDRLSSTGFTDKGAEPVTEIQRQLMNQYKIANIQMSDHASSPSIF